MNRQQAENILDFYVDMEASGMGGKARQSLREVILDAMEDTYTLSYSPITTTPYIGEPLTVTYSAKNARES